MNLANSTIFDDFYAHVDPVQAAQMAAYMKNVCPFLGIPKPLRAALSRDFLKQCKKATTIDWEFVDKCWGLEREFQYLAVEYLQICARLLVPKDIPQLRKLVTTKSWWDTVDALDTVIGNIALTYPEANDTLLAWSCDGNIWLRRIAIDHQLQRKVKTDTALLERILINNLNQKEFFINKAIGWSLREYSKTNPDWVRAFIDEHRHKMAALSIREASKYL